MRGIEMRDIAQRVRLLVLGICTVTVLGCGAEDSAAVTQNSVIAESTDTAQPRVTTTHGEIRGDIDDGVLTFKGVRYGADTAETRFAAPELPNGWQEPADAIEFGPSCPQDGGGALSLFSSWAPAKDPGQSEDCLFLNVWTPSVEGGKRPVMVWLHGGGFTSGSGSSAVYDGVRLVNRGDVVVVTVNHRLNVFGYLYLDQFSDQFPGSGTAGMMDLVMALEWVRDNIAAFGGDPDNVMIFGESGGGWKVSTLMAMPAAQGLFHRAVAQSGPGLEIGTAESSAAAAEALLDELDINESEVAQILDVPSEKLLTAAIKVSAAGQRPGARPVVDGHNIHRHPFSPDAPSESRSVALMIGSTQTEMSMLAGAARRELFELTWETLPQALAASIPGVKATAVIDGYRQLHSAIDPVNLYFEALTDNSTFGRGSFTMADRKAEQGGAPVYQYYLTWPTPVEGGMWGATHALDLCFVFDNIAKSESMCGSGERQQKLADAMSEAWLAFARSGDPNHPGLPEWPTYNSATRATMIFDDVLQVQNDPRGRQRALLDAR